jgi:UDP-glucose 4-epimerase
MNLEGKSIFITGGAGFIGSTLIGRLIDKNKICAFDNFARDSIKDKSFRDHKNLTLVKGDVLDAEHVARSMAGADIVVHCAAIAGIDTVSKSPCTTLRVNMIGSANVLEAAAKLPKCDRVVCFSTSEIFGSHAFRSAETDAAVIGAVGEPRWTYAVGKLAEEHLAIAYHKEHGLPVSVVRPFNVYGPGQVGEGGSQIRAWCYVDDMVEAVLRCMADPKAVGETFNIGNARAICTILGLAETTVRVTGSTSKVTLVPRDQADIALRIPNVTKARELLGFEAKVDLEEGIRAAAEFYKTHSV